MTEVVILPKLGGLAPGPCRQHHFLCLLSMCSACTFCVFLSLEESRDAASHFLQQEPESKEAVNVSNWYMAKTKRIFVLKFVNRSYCLSNSNSTMVLLPASLKGK